ncbi:MAG: hypothetical protein HOV94_41230 [Saccharothrix sp.]|nr:hypothetical protein [Saccharothrix sp.]
MPNRRTDEDQDDIDQLREEAAARAAGDTATAEAAEAVLRAVDTAEPDQTPGN